MSTFLTDSIRVAMILFLLTFIVACNETTAPVIPPVIPDNGSSGGSPSQPPPTAYVFESLSWEIASNRDGKDWSSFIFAEIELYGQALLSTPVIDVGTFCPNYDSLSKYQKINFWGALISGMVRYESNYNPTMRYVESTMGADPITGVQVASEGLLQLSYQDSKWYPFCNEFSWEADKNLAANDPRKTILDPYKNLRCGLKILNQQIANKKEITVSKGAYWAVILEGGKYQQIAGIAAITGRLSFCQ
jgi:hypothetical protein